MLKHYRGKKEKYSYLLQLPTEEHKNGIYFSNDTNEILMNGDTYGKNGDTALVGKEILISEGPLASKALEVFPEGKIPQNITINELLTKLFCKTIYPSISYTKAALSVTTPTITESVSPTSTIVEVGTTLSATFTGGSASTSHNNNSISGFSNGYVQAAVDGLGNFVKPESYEILLGSITENWTSITFPSAGYKLEITKCTGGLSNSLDSTLTSTAETSITNLKYTFTGTAVAGLNECAVKETTPTATGIVPKDIPAGKYFIVSNTNSIDTLYVNVKCTNNVGEKAGETYTASAKTDTASKSWTGVYPILSNGTVYSGKGANDDAVVKSTEVAESSTLSKESTLWVGEKTLYIKFPTLAKFKWLLGIPQYYSNTTVTGKSFDNLVSHNYVTNATFSKVIGSDGKPVTGIATCGSNNATLYVYELWECLGFEGANGVLLVINLN